MRLKLGMTLIEVLIVVAVLSILASEYVVADGAGANSVWNAIFMDNPNANGPLAGVVTFAVTVPTATTFTATATRSGTQSMTINETKKLCRDLATDGCGTWPKP